MKVEGTNILGEFISSPRIMYKKEFEVIRLLDQTDKNNYNNEVLITRVVPDIDKYKDCIVIHIESPFVGYTFSGSSYYIGSPESTTEVLNKLFNLGLFTPADLNEMLMKSRINPKKNSIIERAYFDQDPSYLGRNSSIGISGDAFFLKDLSRVTVVSLGGVKLGNNIHIGNNVIIYRGLLGLTEIADNTWIGDNCIIHHDSKVSGYIKDNSIISNESY